MRKWINHSLHKALCTVFAFVIIISAAFSGEGMWLPLLLKSLNEAEMKAMGMKMSADDIYSINKGSLKDAVVLFGGFCTGEVISDKGLLFTNHHCGYDAIQSHSTLEKNYLSEGFWAKDLSEEKPNPGLYATFIIRMEDVTEKVTTGLSDEMDAKAKQSLIDQNSKAAIQSASKETWQEAFIRPFFEGNQYYLFVTETYNDVRYVGSPPESIGKFGADTDNWVWPRHTGDFSVFRIYAGPDNKPAAYSPDNVPMKPRHFFPISLDGIDEGDFTLIFGFPGRTNQYLSSYAVEQVVNIVDPARIGVRDISLGIMDKHMRVDQDARLAYSSKYASLANSWKKWVGEIQGLKNKKAVQEIAKREADFMSIIEKDPALKSEYGQILPSLKSYYKELDTITYNRTILAEVIGGSNVELFRLTSWASRLVNAFKENGEAGFLKASAPILEASEEFYRDYRKNIDEELYAALINHLLQSLSPQYYSAELIEYASLNPEECKNKVESVYSSSILVDKTLFLETIKKGGEPLTQAMMEDPAYKVFMGLKNVMDTQLTPPYTAVTEKINTLQKDYVAALMAAYPKRKFWPDANSTLRVTYGNVEAYEPKDGVRYKTQTYLDGIMEKYKPGDYEFDVHPRLMELYNKKDYGQYGENGKMPVCFIASNHTTGGNSGSPAIDAHGNLIGINFDRVWEGTMSDLYYDRSICRNIMVDIRFVLFVIDKFAGAGYLLNEMKLVHPKA